MTPSQEVATTEENALGLPQDEYDALLAQQEGEFTEDTLSTPILKVGQPLTKEVGAGQAEAGEFINTLVGDGIGTEIDFIVAYYQPGRFASDKETNRAYAAFGDLIPEHWEDLVGAQFVGTRFDEYPDAEEQYKARVNNKEIQWGSGPLVSTTHNYTGLVLVDDELQPVRLSLKRTDMPAVRKINSLKKGMLRNKPFWNRVFHLSTEEKAFKKGRAFLLVPKLGRDTTAEERLAAVELAKAVAAGRTTDNQVAGGGDKAVEPDAKGGLAI